MATEIKPAYCVGTVKVTRQVLLKTLSDIVEQKALPAIDCAALTWLIDKANSEWIVEVGKPEDAPSLVLKVTPREEAVEGKPWVVISLQKEEDQPSEA